MTTPEQARIASLVVVADRDLSRPSNARDQDIRDAVRILVPHLDPTRKTMIACWIAGFLAATDPPAPYR